MTKAWHGLTKVEVTPRNKIIQDKILDFIKVNALSPGDKLPTEAELAAKIGVSRTAIREALRGLEALGVIEVQQGSGRYLKNLDLGNIFNNLTYNLVFESKSLLDLLEIRAVLEINFIKDAIFSLKEEDLGELKRIITLIQSKIQEGKSFTEEDRQFHATIFRNLNNKILKQLLDVFWRLFSESLAEGLKLSEDKTKVLQHHIDLWQAVQKKDVQEATNLLRDHFNEVKKRLQRVIK